MRPLFLLTLCLVLTACGYKGSLYLPDECTQACTAPAAPAAPARTQTTQP